MSLQALLEEDMMFVLRYLIGIGQAADFEEIQKAVIVLARLLS
jgi:hypothetical protein